MNESFDTLRRLLADQTLGVLGTHGQGAPYTSLVGFAASANASLPICI